MKFFQSVLVSTLLLGASAAWARPTIRVDVKDEVRNVEQKITELQSYQDQKWAIGLTGDTLRPDAFVKFFTDRALPLKFYVRSLDGLVLGTSEAYQQNIATLRAYEQKIINQELADVRKAMNDLQRYKQDYQAIGLTGDTLQPDQFLRFFGERGLDFQIFLLGQSFAVGGMSAYDQNLNTLQMYLDSLRMPAESTSM